MKKCLIMKPKLYTSLANQSSVWSTMQPRVSVNSHKQAVPRYIYLYNMHNLQEGSYKYMFVIDSFSQS